MELLGRFSSLVQARLPEIERSIQSLEGIQQRITQEKEDTEKLTFISTKSKIDAFSGFISSDCTKEGSKFFECFMDKAWNVKIFTEEEWIGNMYLIEIDDYLIVDAIQVPFISVSAAELWEKALLKLSEVAKEKGKTLVVSEFLSNYQEIKDGFKKLEQSYKEIDRLEYPSKYVMFESAKKGFYKIE